MQAETHVLFVKRSLPERSTHVLLSVRISLVSQPPLWAAPCVPSNIKENSIPPSLRLHLFFTLKKKKKLFVLALCCF